MASATNRSSSSIASKHAIKEERQRLHRVVQIFFLSMGILVTALFFWEAQTSIQREQQRQINQTQVRLSLLADRIARTITENFHDLVFLRQLVQYSQVSQGLPDAHSLRALRSFQATHSSSFAINLFDASGNHILWSTPGFHSKAPVVPLSDFVPGGNHHDWLVALPRYAHRYGSWIIPMRVPIYSPNGSIQGYLGRPTRLLEILAQDPFPASSALAIKHGSQTVWLPSTQPLAARSTFTGTDLILAAPIPSYPWVLEIRWPKASWLTSLPPLSWISLTAPFLAILILLIFLQRLTLRGLDRMLELRRQQAAALAIHQRLLEEPSPAQLPQTFCETLVQVSGIPVCLLFDYHVEVRRLHLLAAADRAGHSISIEDVILPEAIDPQDSHLPLAQRALLQGRQLRSSRLEECHLASTLRHQLQLEEICCAVAQPILLRERLEAPWGVLIFLMDQPLAKGQLLDAFITQVSEIFGLLQSLWDRNHALEQAAVRLSYLRDFDQLTGAANRQQLDRFFAALIHRTGESNQTAALAIVDLDDFHQVNKVQGKEVGDWILRCLRERFQKIVGDTGIVARVGGDEFILLFSYDGTREALLARLSQLEITLQQPLEQRSKPILLSASMGVAILRPDDEHFLDNLMRRADQALAESKAHKADRSHNWAIYGEAITTRPQSLAQRLLAEEALEVWYQPIIEGEEGRVVGVEALARLVDHEGQVLSPAQFLPHLPLAEIQQLSWMVLTRALEDLEKLEQSGWPLWFSFNVPAESFTQYCMPCLRGSLANTRLSPERITIEILEGGDFLDQSVAIEVLQEIRQMGIHLALDDVGTAYASLQRLHDLPVNKIKVDQHFVRGLEEHPQDLHFIRILQDLAIETGLEMVVEGVETAEILDALVSLGVSQLQGYAIARPMPLPQLLRYLENPIRAQVTRPATLLGFYAGIMATHTLIKRTLQPLGRQVLILESALRREGPYDEALQRLGYTVGDPLHLAYRHYQTVLTRALVGRANDLRGVHWQSVELAWNTLQKQILAERDRDVCATEAKG